MTKGESRVLRYLKKYKLDIGWLDELVMDIKHQQAVQLTNQRVHVIEYLLRHRSKSELVAHIKHLATVRNRHVAGQYGVVKPEKKHRHHSRRNRHEKDRKESHQESRRHRH